MRALCAVALITHAAVASAQPTGTPPSRTLERAIKLYDKQDFYSVTVELQKVLDGETGDDEANRQRAEFFMGKTLFQIKYNAASLAMFDRLVHNTAHPYHLATIKWLIAIAEATPTLATRVSLGAYPPDAAADPMFDDRTRDAFHYYLGRSLADRNTPAAVATLGKATGSYRTRAALELAKIAFREQRIDDAVAAVEIAATDPTLTADAVRVVATWSRLLHYPEHALAELGRLASTSPLAALESSRVAAIARFPDLAGVSTETFDAIVIATTCANGGTADDGVPALRATVADLRQQLDKLLDYDDHAELHEAVEKALPGSPLLRLALLDTDTNDARRWDTELMHELELLQHADRAWQTTQIASQILQELTVQLSVGQADTGKRYGMRLDNLRRDLALLARSFDGHAPLAIGPPVRSGRGITVDKALCSSQLGMAASEIAGPAAPIKPQPPRATGCAGCTSGSSDPGSLALVVVVVVAGAIGRRHRSARVVSR